MRKITKTYRELSRLETFEERLEYLYIGDKIGDETFGSSRYLNQQLYSSYEWKRVRNEVILRDMGCDLGVDGCDLSNRNIIVHHMNPITEQDILERNPVIFDMDNLISVSRSTHNYIHFGAKSPESKTNNSFERKQNDTCPWKGGV